MAALDEPNPAVARDATFPEQFEPEPALHEEFEWDVEADIQLFYAMLNHKPLGINKYFNMIAIWDKLQRSISREVTTRDIWKHLDTLFDMNMLDDTEPIPFPIEDVEFSLPEEEYGELMRQKIKDIGIVIEEEDRAASPQIQSTPRSVSRGATSRENTPKDSSRSDLRRDSRDSIASAGGRESIDLSKSISRKGKKGSKGSSDRSTKGRLSTGDEGNRTPDSEASNDSKREAKRPTRGSLARAVPESTPPTAPTPPSARRRRI